MPYTAIHVSDELDGRSVCTIIIHHGDGRWVRDLYSVQLLVFVSCVCEIEQRIGLSHVKDEVYRSGWMMKIFDRLTT